MSTSCRNAWLATLSLVVSVSVWEEEMRVEAECRPATEPDTPPIEQTAPMDSKDDAPSSPAPVKPAPILVPVARDPEESEPCPPVRRAAPRLVRRDYSWRWCSPP
jgi:hypothetical protein